MDESFIVVVFVDKIDSIDELDKDEGILLLLLGEFSIILVAIFSLFYFSLRFNNIFYIFIYAFLYIIKYLFIMNPKSIS